MELFALIAVLTSVLLAINVGGNNSAAEMGPAFGSGIRSKREAVILIAVFSMIGAIVAGEHVVATVGGSLMPSQILKDHFGAVIIILLSATSIIALANILHVPIATSHAMVGAVVGIGIFYGQVNWPKVGEIVIWWLATPATALISSYLIGRFVYPRLSRHVDQIMAQHTAQRLYRIFVTLSGCYMAFSAGSNSLAKAVGPIVGAGILTSTSAAVVGGLSMAAGAFIVGHKLMHTVGKGITPLDPLKATLVEIICGTILLISSYSGVPISLAETVTCSVIGFGAAHSGLLITSQNKHVRTIYKLWPICPFFTAALSFSLAWLVRALQ